MNQELQNAFERAREASRGRVIREAAPRHINKQAEREKHGAPMRVIHPEIGSVVVKARSPFDAQCAAEEKLGLPFLALRGCEVWASDHDSTG